MNEFLTQLKRKRDLLLEVLTITQAQPQIIADEDTDTLLGNIGKRQMLIDELDAIQAEMPDRETLRGSPECLDLVTEVNGILKEIEAQDAQNERAALARMEELRGQIRKVNDGKKTFAGYESVGANQIGGIYINKQK